MLENPHPVRYPLLGPTLHCPYHKVQNFPEYLQHTHNAILIIIIILIIVMLSCHVMMIYRLNTTAHLIIGVNVIQKRLDVLQNEWKMCKGRGGCDCTWLL